MPNEKSLSFSFSVQETPEEVFSAIQQVNNWWSEDIKGSASNVGDEFVYRFRDIHYSKMRIIEVVPFRKIVWLVLDNAFNFTKDKHEWIGNHVVFDISTSKHGTTLQFTQLGLVPEYECYSACSSGWSNYITNSLYSLITTGKGKPIEKDGSNEFEDNVQRPVVGF